MKAPNRIATLAAAAILAACADAPRTPTSAGVAPVVAADPTASVPPVASAQLRTATGQPAGTVTFAPAPGGVALSVNAQGLAPGAHGFHIHANGACEPGPDPTVGKIVDFGAAGGHFDPGHSRNHGRPGEDMAHSHAGELPVLEAGPDGRGALRYVNTQISLDRSATSVMGRTVVVHADPDDYASDPAGNSGARILCGVIEALAPTPVQGRATIEGTQVFPEGIAVDARTGDAYVGSTTNGDLFRIRAGTGRAELVQTGGAVGRQGAYGMKVDGAGRLWVAGGPTGSLALVEPASASTLAVWKAPTDAPSFLNDLAIARDGSVYVTDAFRPVLYRVRPAGGAPAVLEPWLDLRQTAVRYQPNEINLNGIVVSDNGRTLLAVQQVTGQLWRIDTSSRAVEQVRVEGGDLTAGDGLLLTGANDLWVMRNAHHELVRLRLAEGWRTARIEQRVTDSRLRYPTTAARSPSGGLMVVNAQLDRQKNPPVLLPFDVLTLDLPRTP